MASLLVLNYAVKSMRSTSSELDAFARCLTSKGATMYGAVWCSHCQNEKNAFGGSFRYVQYVECSKEPKKCAEAGIDSYPTWIFPGGEKLVGEQGIYRLAKISECPSP